MESLNARKDSETYRISFAHPYSANSICQECTAGKRLPTSLRMSSCRKIRTSVVQRFWYHPLSFNLFEVLKKCENRELTIHLVFYEWINVNGNISLKLIINLEIGIPKAWSAQSINHYNNVLRNLWMKNNSWMVLKNTLFWNWQRANHFLFSHTCYALLQHHLV